MDFFSFSTLAILSPLYFAICLAFWFSLYFIIIYSLLFFRCASYARCCKNACPVLDVFPPYLVSNFVSHKPTERCYEECTAEPKRWSRVKNYPVSNNKIQKPKKNKGSKGQTKNWMTNCPNAKAQHAQ